MPLIADSHSDGFYEYNTDSKDVQIGEFAMDFNYTKCRSLRAPTAEVLLSSKMLYFSFVEAFQIIVPELEQSPAMI